MKHNWSGSYTYQHCSKCGRDETCGCDWMDSPGIQRFLNRIANLDDCSGKMPEIKEHIVMGQDSWTTAAPDCPL